jgi:hypothetical protein
MNEGDDRTLIISLSEISRGLRVEASASTLVDEMKKGATTVEGRGEEEDTRRVLLVAAAAAESSGNVCVDRRPEEEGTREDSEEDTEETGSSGVRECAYVCASTRRGMHTT